MGYDMGQGLQVSGDEDWRGEDWKLCRTLFLHPPTHQATLLKA